MAATESQSSDVGVVQRALGRYIEDDTAVAITVTCGFKPRYVKVVNTTAGIMMEWFEGMTDGYGVKTGVDGARSLITTLGITVSEGGFVIGLDTDLNVINEQLSWIAFG